MLWINNTYEYIHNINTYGEAKSLTFDGRNAWND